MDLSNIENIELSYLNIEDYEELKQIMIEIYGDGPSGYWRKEQIQKLINIFPEGQIVIKINANFFNAGRVLS